MTIVRWLEKPRSQVGDLFCSGVDIADFMKNYRAQLFPDQWNVWLLKRTINDNPSTQDLKDKAWAVLMYWFGVIRGDFDHLQVTVSPSEKMLQALHMVSSVSTNAVPVTMAEPSKYVLVQFVYRGTISDMPWPVSHKYQLYEWWCPKDCTWAVDTVYAPLAQPVPDQPTWVDVFSEAAARAAAAAAAAAKKILPGFGDLLPLGVVAAVLGTLYVVNKVVSKAPSFASVKIGEKKPEELPPAGA